MEPIKISAKTIHLAYRSDATDSQTNMNWFTREDNQR